MIDQMPHVIRLAAVLDRGGDGEMRVGQTDDDEPAAAVTAAGGRASVSRERIGRWHVRTP
jgi:hypothetical protein